MSKEEKHIPRLDEVMGNLKSQNFQMRPRRQQLLSYEDGQKAFEYISAKCAYEKHHKFYINQFNEQIIVNMIKWFIADPTCAWDIHKGICLSGQPGIGKTFLFEIFARFLKAWPDLAPMFNYSCVTIDKEVEENSKRIYHYYNGHVCFDELGGDRAVLKSYGNVTSVMGEIIFKRYSKWERGGLITHFTSNLTKKEIEERYGSRNWDRLNGSVNFVVNKQKESFRK